MANDNELLLKVKADTDKATKEISRLTKEVDKFTKSSKKNTKTLREQDKSLKKIKTSTNDLTKSLKGVVAGAGALGIALKAVDFANLAASAQQSSDAFDKVFTDMGLNAKKEFDKIKEASMGLIPDASIKQSAVTAASLGVPISKLSQLMEVARAKAREMGTDAKSAFDDLATGIGRGSPMILDNLGLTIKLADANQKWADANNITVQSMTKQQKQLALTNAVIEAGAKSVERYADAQLSSKEKMQKFNASLDNLKVKIGNELLPQLTKLAESTTKWVNSIDPKAFKNFGDAVSGIAASLTKLAGLLSDLNDIAMPDILGGKDAGLIGTVAEGLGKLIDLFTKASDVLKNLSISKNLSTETEDTISKVDNLTNSISQLTKGVEANDKSLSLQGDGLKKLRKEYNKSASALTKALNKNLKLQEFFINDRSKERGAEQLKKLRKEQSLLEKKSEELGNTYKTIFSEDVPKSIKKSTKEIKKLSKAEADVLYKLNKDRIKNAEKTVKSLKGKEKKLTKDILSLNKKLSNDLKTINDERLNSKISINSQIQELERGGLNIKEAYYQKEKDAAKLLSDAKKALLKGDLDAYKSYANEYRSLIEKNGDKAITKNGAIIVSEKEVRKNSIEDLKKLSSLENQYYDKKAEKATQAHDKEVAFKNAEIELVKLNIQAQLELIKLSSVPKGTPVDSTALDAVLKKIDGLKQGLSDIEKTPAKVISDNTSLDTTKNKIEEVKKLTIDGVTLDIKSDTTAADFGIKKLITTTKKDEISIDVNPEYTKAQKKIDDFRKEEANKTIDKEVALDTKKANDAIKKIETPTKSTHKIDANTTQAQTAINKLKQPTSSVHTVYEKVVPARASGGLIPQRLASGGAFTGSGKVPGYDATDSDSVNAKLTGGEYVINRRAVDAIGVETLNAINQFRFNIPKFAQGGQVPTSQSGTVSSAQTPINLTIGSSTYQVMSDADVAAALVRNINGMEGM